MAPASGVLLQLRVPIPEVKADRYEIQQNPDGIATIMGNCMRSSYSLMHLDKTTSLDQA